MSRLDNMEGGPYLLNYILVAHWCGSFFVCASVLFVEGIASERVSDQRKNLTQGDRSTVGEGGLHLIGHAAVTPDLIFYVSAFKVGSVFCNDIKSILVGGSFSEDFRDFEPKYLLLITK